MGYMSTKTLRKCGCCAPAQAVDCVACMSLKHAGTNNWRHTPPITQLKIIKQNKNYFASRLKGLLAALILKLNFSLACELRL